MTQLQQTNPEVAESERTGCERAGRLGPVSLGAELLLWLALVLARAPALLFDVVDIDETDFFIIGRLMHGGALPYVDVVEKKPILTYLPFYYTSQLGWSMHPSRLLALGVLALMCLLLRRAAARWTGSALSGQAAAWIAVLATTANVWSVNAELILNLFQALALLLFVRYADEPDVGRALLVGLAAGLAALCKHQGAVLLPAFALAVLWSRPRRWLPDWLALGTGFALPWVATAAAYQRLGHLPAFLEWNFTRNLVYSGHAVGSVALRFIEGFGLCVVLGAPLWWWLAGRQLLALWRRRAAPRPTADHHGAAFGLVLIFTLVPVCMGKRFYEHYFLQLVPPLALLAAPGAAELWARRAALPLARRRLLWVLSLGPALCFTAFLLGRGLQGGYPCQEPRTRAVAAWLRAHSAADDRLFVWGHYSPVYYLAQRLPGTRYLATSVHMGDFDPHHLPAGFDIRPFISARDVAQTLDDLTHLRPRWIVDTAPADIHEWGKVPLAAFPALDAFIQAHYRRVADPGGAAVYLRRD